MEDVDVERTFPQKETAAKLRRIADAIEAGKSFRIQVNGYRVRVPAGARIDIGLEYERYEGSQVEIEIKWKHTGYGN
jgi:amphi-Trp domain-containing protein